MSIRDYHKLNRLSQINNNTGILFSHGVASPGSHCPMHTSLATISKIEGVSSLVVGMPECGYYSRYVMEEPIGKKGELHYVYVLDSNEVVFGCSEGLKKALIEMKQDGAKAIMVIITCVPALIGEDIMGVIEELVEETDAKIVCMDMAHFKRNGYQSGFYQTYEKLADFIPAKEGTRENRVTIMGSLSGKEGEELLDYLKTQKIEVLELNSELKMELLVDIVDSKLNIVTSTNFLKLAQKINNKFNIPFVFLGGSYDSNIIIQSYNEIFKHLGIEGPVDFFYQNELANYLKEWGPAMKGYTYIITTSNLDNLCVASYLCQLGMIPELLHVEEFDENSFDWKNEILQTQNDPYVTYISNKEQSIAGIDEKIHISLGEYVGINENKIVEGQKLTSLTRLCGFERTFVLLDMIITCLKKNIRENVWCTTSYIIGNK